MFSYLIETVFPALGETFGFLSAIAELPFNFFIEFLTNGWALSFNNLYTGELISVSLPNLSFLGDILSNITKLAIPTAIYNLPTWVCLLYCSFSIFIGFYILKWVFSLFK